MASTFDLEVARRLPLADATLRILDYVCDQDFLSGVFSRYRGRSYEDVLTFPQLVRLLTDTLIGPHNSSHQAFQHAQAEQTLTTSVQAVYRKLGRVPIPLSLGFFTETISRLQTIAAPNPVLDPPSSLRTFRLLGFDGKKIKYVAHKLKPLRGLNGNIYGGKLLVVQDLVTQQAVAAEAVPDGEAADNPLVPAAVMRVRESDDQRPRVWVGDRAFCDYPLLALLTEGHDHVVVRFKATLPFEIDPCEPARVGTDSAGRPYREDWGWLGQAESPFRRRVRRVTLSEPTRDPLILVTSLTDADAYPAAELLALYRARWGLEVMFQRVVQTFDLRHVISGTPQATVFQAMLCLLLYNITMTVRDYVAEGVGQSSATVSLSLVFEDVVRDMTAWFRVIPTGTTLEILELTRECCPESFRTWLRERLGRVWKKSWTKSPTRRGPGKVVHRAYICGGHTSVDKILRGMHNELPLQGSESTKSMGQPPPCEAKNDG